MRPRSRPLRRECALAQLRMAPTKRAWRWHDSGFAHDRCPYPEECPCACHFSRIPVGIWIALVAGFGVVAYLALYWALQALR
jgi:hypothetical protein